jgi:iron complex outermembrane receptor protein
LEEDFYGRGSVTVGDYNQGDLKVNLNAPLGGSGWVARVAAASLSRDGYGKNLVTDQEVSDKEILAARATLGYVGNPDFWVRRSPRTGWTTSPACAARRCWRPTPTP